MTSPLPARRGRPGAPPPPPPPDVYPNYLEFYEEELRFYYQRNIDGDIAWCPEWQIHSEAVYRIRALHVAWENANRDRALAPWWVNIADPMMRELFDPRNTFKGCTMRVGHRTPGNPDLPSTVPAPPPTI